MIIPRSTEHVVKSSMTDDKREAELSQDVADIGGGWCLRNTCLKVSKACRSLHRHILDVGSGFDMTFWPTVSSSRNQHNYQGKKPDRSVIACCLLSHSFHCSFIHERIFLPTTPIMHSQCPKPQHPSHSQGLYHVFRSHNRNI